jgi:hypothetical protein
MNRHRILLACSAVAVVALSACGSSKSPATPDTGPRPSSTVSVTTLVPGDTGNRPSPSSTVAGSTATAVTDANRPATPATTG